MTRTEMDAYLPGNPSKLLIRKVRQHLKGYGIVPRGTYASRNNLWKLAWRWAWSVAESYDTYRVLKEHERRRHRWPSPSEIGAQYLALLLAEMRDNHDLKLPFRASDHCPLEARVALAPASTHEPLALPAASESSNGA